MIIWNKHKININKIIVNYETKEIMGEIIRH